MFLFIRLFVELSDERRFRVFFKVLIKPNLPGLSLLGLTLRPYDLVASNGLSQQGLPSV